MHVVCGKGDGTTLYLGERAGSPFVSVDLRGFNGWTSRPAWMPGGWAFFRPTLMVGYVFTDRPVRSWSLRVLLPSRMVDLYRWRISPRGRRYMREYAHDQPMPDPSAP